MAAFRKCYKSDLFWSHPVMRSVNMMVIPLIRPCAYAPGMANHVIRNIMQLLVLNSNCNDI